MNRYEDFWIVTILRGLLAILIGSGILVLPDMAGTLLLLPLAFVITVLSLAVYGILDSALVFATSFFTSLRPACTALRLQSACGVVIGVLFCSTLIERVHLEWFLYLIALQAFATACSEFVIARHTSRKHGARRSYAAACMALICAVTYAIAASVAPSNLSYRQIALLAYAYLVAFGVAQTLMAISMLHLEHRTNAPAHLAEVASVPRAV